MPLDIYFMDDVQSIEECTCSTCDLEHTREYFKQLGCVNITHSLSTMADACGIYGCLWKPEENGIEAASDLIEPLLKAVSEMDKNPKKFLALQDAWGTYEVFRKNIMDILFLCGEYPHATIQVST